MVLPNPFDKDSGIIIEISGKLYTLLIMKGTKIGFMSQVTMKEELGTYEHVFIASPEP